jgi:hypothetical protein
MAQHTPAFSLQPESYILWQLKPRMTDMYFRMLMCSLCHLVAVLALKSAAITIKAFVKQHSKLRFSASRPF